MPAKIIDQYTDRTDLSATQKHYLRHPEKLRSTEYMDPHAEASRKWRGRQQHKKLVTKHARSNPATRPNNPVWAGICKEIADLAKRGKPLASICVWYNIPMSQVQQIVADSLLPS